jgi:transposase
MAALPPSQEQSLLLTVPEVGLTTAMAIVGNTEDISRFGDNAHWYVAYCGLAPARYQSGLVSQKAQLDIAITDALSGLTFS